MKDERICSCCGAKIENDDCYELYGQLLCEDCWLEQTTTCVRCGERIWREDNVSSSDRPICQECYDEYYARCSDCGTIIEQENSYYEDGYYYCDDCYEKRRNKLINDYYYKPEPVFYGTGSRYFGVELEIDEAGEDEGNAEIILAIANRTAEHIYCKHDGSIDEGFELVSHPMTLDYHIATMPWLDVLCEAQRLGYLSHQTSTCGLHIHVNRNSFGTTEAVQEEAIARVLYFFEKHWEELLRFSRRSRIQLERWAARYGYKEQPKDILDHAKKGYHGGRYTCVNLQNADTIEFRIFRGTLKYNTFIATLQLVNQVCDVAIRLSDEQMRRLTWSEFAADCTEQELVQYLKERRLYINEEICSAEEV